MRRIVAKQRKTPYRKGRDGAKGRAMPGMSVVSAFSAEHVSRVTGLTLRQLAFWDRCGFFKPSLMEPAKAGRSPRIYSFIDVVGLRVIAVLRNQHGVPLQQLKRAAEKLALHSKTPWASLKLTISKGEVGFIEPGTGRARTVLSGQYILMPLIDQIRHVEQAILDLSRRTPEQFGRAEQKRNIAHNRLVFAGTRVPISAVETYLAEGYSDEKILDEYPSLSKADIDMVRRKPSVHAAA
jgi:uncharacterized protein (DUF433 family)